MSHRLSQLAKVVAISALFTLSSVAFADATLTDVSKNITTAANTIAVLLNVAAYVAGVGFALAGILAFKSHKDNPQQNPLSKCVVLIVVAACLLFLPAIMKVAGSSLFGTSASSSGASTYKGELSGS